MTLAGWAYEATVDEVYEQERHKYVEAVLDLASHKFRHVLIEVFGFWMKRPGDQPKNAAGAPAGPEQPSPDEGKTLEELFVPGRLFLATPEQTQAVENLVARTRAAESAVSNERMDAFSRKLASGDMDPVIKAGIERLNKAAADKSALSELVGLFAPEKYAAWRRAMDPDAPAPLAPDNADSAEPAIRILPEDD